MDSTLPVPVPIPYKSRRGWLIGFGISEILIGIAFILLLAVVAFAFFVHPSTRTHHGAAAAGPVPQLALMIIVLLQYGLFAAIFITAGVGSILCRNWARIMMLVVSGLWLGFGALGTLVMAFMMPTIMQQTSSIPCDQQHHIIVVIITFMAALGVVLPAIYLFVYSRKGVKATCHAHKPVLAIPAASATTVTTTPSTIPIPLAVLGVWEALGALSVFGILLVRSTFLFGTVIHGVAAIAVMLGIGALCGVAAWAVFRQKIWGWNLTLLKALWGGSSILVTYLRRPDLLQLYRDLGLSEQSLRMYDRFPQFLPLTWLGSLAVTLIFIAFVLYTRPFFPKTDTL